MPSSTLRDTSSPGRRVIVEAAGCVRAGPYSLAVESGDMVFTSGQIGLQSDTGALIEGGFEAEAAQVFRNLGALLDAADLRFSDTVKCNVFITDVAHFATFNEIYRSHFAEPYPARTTIGVADLPLGAGIEIELVLRRDDRAPTRV
jgi:2-iminobutanoate/2-iminopropanoate deaminase